MVVVANRNDMLRYLPPLLLPHQHLRSKRRTSIEAQCLVVMTDRRSSSLDEEAHASTTSSSNQGASSAATSSFPPVMEQPNGSKTKRSATASSSSSANKKKRSSYCSKKVTKSSSITPMTTSSASSTSSAVNALPVTTTNTSTGDASSVYIVSSTTAGDYIKFYQTITNIVQVQASRPKPDIATRMIADLNYSPWSAALLEWISKTLNSDQIRELGTIPSVHNIKREKTRCAFLAQLGTIIARDHKNMMCFKWGVCIIITIIRT